MTRKCLGRAVLALGTALAIGVPAGADDLTDRIDRMERELQELKREMQRRNAGAPAAAPAPAAPTTAEAPPPAAPPPAVATAPAPQKAGAAQDAERVIEAVTSRVNIGAYGSMRYEASNIDEAHSTFTFRRFVLTADANIAPRLKAAMELEFERFRKLELEKSSGPEEGGLFTLFGILFFLISVTMVGIGLIGEYVGRTYQVVRTRQRYRVREILETKR